MNGRNAFRASPEGVADRDLTSSTWMEEELSFTQFERLIWEEPHRAPGPKDPTPASQAALLYSVGQLSVLRHSGGLRPAHRRGSRSLPVSRDALCMFLICCCNHQAAHNPVITRNVTYHGVLKWVINLYYKKFEKVERKLLPTVIVLFPLFPYL